MDYELLLLFEHHLWKVHRVMTRGGVLVEDAGKVQVLQTQVLKRVVRPRESTIELATAPQ